MGWRMGVWVEVGLEDGRSWGGPRTHFLQHRLTLTDSSAAFHFRWKSMVLHLRSDSSMMSSCRHKPRERLKNCHLDFWQRCANPVSLEGFETSTKFGPASSLSPHSLGKHPPRPQFAAENIHLVTQDLEFGIPRQPVAPRCQLVLTN